MDKEIIPMLHGRKDAAIRAGISLRNLDYRLANREFDTRKIGGRVMITHSSLVRFTQANHPVLQIPKKAA